MEGDKKQGMRGSEGVGADADCEGRRMQTVTDRMMRLDLEDVSNAALSVNLGYSFRSSILQSTAIGHSLLLPMWPHAVPLMAHSKRRSRLECASPSWPKWLWGECP